MIQMKSYSFQGKRAVIRVDFNVPLHKETLEVQDDKRINAAMPTVKWVLKQGEALCYYRILAAPKTDLKIVFL